MSRKPEDLAGRRFGRLTAVRIVAREPARWECRCDCGNTAIVRAGCLKNGTTKSCGCLRREASRESRKRTEGVPRVSDDGNPSDLAKLRLERGLTCKRLAVKVGVHRSTVSQWETGVRIPSDPRIALLAEALDVDEREVRRAVRADDRRGWGLEGFARDRGLTLAALAKRARVREGTVVKWSNGEVDPTLSQARMLADAMGVSVGRASSLLAESRAGKLLADNPSMDAHALALDLGCGDRMAASLISRFEDHVL